MFIRISLFILITLLVLRIRRPYRFRKCFGLWPAQVTEETTPKIKQTMQTLGNFIGSLALLQEETIKANGSRESILQEALRDKKAEWGKAMDLIADHAPQLMHRIPHWSDDPQGVYYNFRHHLERPRGFAE
jgi:hypothetical protein